MSYRATTFSPRPTFGLGIMPGRTDYTTSNYSTYRRSGSATRKYESSGSSYLSNRGSSISRPLPPGPGPLDTAGRKLSESRRTSASSYRSGPLKADHSYTPSVGTLPRKFSTNSVYAGSSSGTTNDYNSRSTRSRSVANFDRTTNDVSNLRLNDYDGRSIKASPRTIDPDDSIISNRESRREKHENGVDWRTGSRVSRYSNTSVNNDDGYSSSNHDIQNHASTSNRDSENRRKDSVTDMQPSKSLSRQSSNSSISTVCVNFSLLCEFQYCLVWVNCLFMVRYSKKHRKMDYQLGLSIEIVRLGSFKKVCCQ